ncbi:MAG: TIGR02391 family protein [Parcubacteria group bacterium]|jgi:uncharacterized protein (TIGR02391 family)
MKLGKSNHKTVSKKNKVRKFKMLSAANIQNIRILAEQLGRLIPLDGYRSSFSLMTIAKTRGLVEYIPKKVNKKEAFSVFIRNLIKEKPRTLKLIVREILPRAIEKRHSEGNPILEQEASELASQLFLLGVDLKKEIKELKLPTQRPKIVPPPIAVQKILDTFPLHPTLLPDCKKMFVDGHLNEAVRKSLEKFEKTVQDLSLLKKMDGQKLMANVFNENDPKIKLNNLETAQEINEQMGFRLTTMGLMTWWRNNLSHGDEEQMPHHEALGRLIMVSNLFSRLDERIS